MADPTTLIRPRRRTTDEREARNERPSEEGRGRVKAAGGERGRKNSEPRQEKTVWLPLFQFGF
jgi:hypothetical protein